MARTLARVMDLTDPRITADRVRAALAFANIDVKDSPAKIGISAATMQRIVSPTKPRGANSDELRQIADACPGVPRWFLEYGFSPPVETGELELRDLLVEAQHRLSILEKDHITADELRELVGGTRSLTHRFKSAADVADVPTPEAGSDTRGAGDATPGAVRAPSAKTPASGQKRAR